MLKMIVYCGLGLAAAVAAPAVLYKGVDFWKTAVRNAAATMPPTPDVAAVPAQPGAGPAAASLDGVPVRTLAEVFNFNVTPDWIMRRWPRVTTGLSHLQLQGYRVPLVTGTAESDLAGSLTYYFSPQQRAERITFCGTTGDSRKLVALLTSQHRLTRRLTNDPGLMVYESVHPNGKPCGACRIRSAPIVKASDAYRRFDVDLVLERPQG
jgi:hypothetical protein